MNFAYLGKIRDLKPEVPVSVIKQSHLIITSHKRCHASKQLLANIVATKTASWRLLYDRATYCSRRMWKDTTSCSFSFPCRMIGAVPRFRCARRATSASSLIHAIPTTDDEILSLEEMPGRSSICLFSYRLLFSPLLFFSRKCTDDDAHGNPYDAPRQ